MKKLLFRFLIAAAIVGAYSCEDELENPSGSGDFVTDADAKSLLGMWAQIDDRQQSDTYIKFDDIFHSKFVSSESCLAHNRTLWATLSDKFKMTESMPYTVAKSILSLDGEQVGKCSLKGDTLTIAENKYLKVNKFTEEVFITSIRFKGEEAIVYDYKSGTKTIEIEIINPLPFLSLSVNESEDWITDLKCKGNIISFNVSENTNWGPRNGKITLTYGSLTEEFSVTQYGDWPLAEDLSSSYTANCYIVSSTNSYIFKTVKGNSSTSVGSVASVEVLWESFGTSETPTVGALIEGVSCSEGYICFTTPDSFREGNAVISAKDANGKILWSWHIWLTDKPEDQVYNNNAGTMMDRNLGATSATPGDVGALGLLYQWGRKDPFLGSSSISSSTTAKSTITWPSAVSSSSSYGTIDYATEHPTTFIGGNSNYDWYYSGSSTRWQSSKTIYDPCPAGYRVPDGGSVYPSEFYYRAGGLSVRCLRE